VPVVGRSVLSARRAVAVGADIQALELAVLGQAQAHLRRATGEFHVIDVEPAGPDAFEDHRLQRTEGGEHVQKGGQLLADQLC
jgi:hypothetical protein